MENAAEALRLAAWVLIFVLALSISMNAFSQARHSIDEIVLYSDREYLQTYVDESPSTHRIVSAESIVPTIFRAYKENYKIKFENVPEEDYLYERKNINGESEKIYYIDLENENISDETLKEYYIKRILFGDSLKTKNPDEWNRYESKVSKSIKFNSVGLYNKIMNNTYEECLGVYYQEERNGTTTESNANKTEKKVITYIKK